MRLGAVPLCTLEPWQPMSRHGEDPEKPDTYGRFGHLVKNETEYAWHVTGWTWHKEEPK